MHDFKTTHDNFIISDVIKEEDKKVFKHLLSDKILLSKVLKRYGPNLSETDGILLKVVPLSDVGQNRFVYLINIININDNQELGAIAVKVARFRDSSADDHVAMTYAVDGHLGRPGNILTKTFDNRYVWFGKHYEGISGDQLLEQNAELAANLIGKSAVKEWFNLGERFIYEPKASQFMINKDQTEARLIDKGHFRRLENVSVTYDFKMVGSSFIYDAYIKDSRCGEMKPFDLRKLDLWLQKMTASDLVIRVASYLDIDMYESKRDHYMYYDVDGGSALIPPAYYFPYNKYLEGVEAGVLDIGFDVPSFYRRILSEVDNTKSEVKSEVLSLIEKRIK